MCEISEKIFKGFMVPAGFQNDLLERHFPPKKVPKCIRESYPDSPGDDLGAICSRIRSKEAFSSIWARFLIDFDKIFEQFSEHV